VKRERSEPNLQRRETAEDDTPEPRSGSGGSSS
jgi:hypothetical protein